MEKLERYKEYVNKMASPTKIKQIRDGCIVLAGALAVSAFSSTLAGLKLSLLAHCIMLLMGALTYFTFLPIFPVLSCVLCLVIQSFVPLGLESLAGYAVLFAGITCSTHTAELYRAFKRDEKARTGDSVCVGGTISESNGSEAKVGFTAKGKCQCCGESSGLYVSGVPASRVIFKRVLADGVSWGAYCALCQKNYLIRRSEAKKLALDSGHYAAYKHAQPANGFLNAFAAFLCVLIASSFLLTVLVVGQNAVYTSGVESSKLDYGKQFVGEDLTLIDCFATSALREWSGDWRDTENILELHMLAYLENENGSFLIPVNVDPKDDIFMPCIKYITGDTNEVVICNIHGNIDAISGKTLKLLTEKAKYYEKYMPGVVTVKNEILYWDSDVTPSEDIKDLRIFQILTGTTGLAATICFVLDIYINSNFHSEKVQKRYDRKKHDYSTV